MSDDACMVCGVPSSACRGLADPIAAHWFAPAPAAPVPVADTTETPVCEHFGHVVVSNNGGPGWCATCAKLARQAAPVPAVPVPDDHSKTMTEIVESLGQSYTPDGVALILSKPSKFVRDERPLIEVCQTAEGRYDVWCMAEAMADGVFV